MMKRYAFAFCVAALVFSGCKTTYVTEIPYNSVRVHIERIHVDKEDHLVVSVDGMPEDMTPSSALTRLRRFYSEQRRDPPPMLLYVRTKLAIRDNLPPDNFFDAVQGLANEFKFALFIQPLPFSQGPSVDQDIDAFMNREGRSNM
jgi:hypothetical protein